jgi:two-component system OmpR family sensor kinase
LPLVKTDRSRLAQILGTLVEQAPDAGPLVLRARSAADHVEIEVGGPPTAAAKTLDDLCEPFPPTEALSPLQDGGRRLRLALARRLALASGGTLTLQQDPAATTFTLTLPAPVDALTFA